METIKVRYIDESIEELEFIGGYGHSTRVDVRASRIKIDGKDVAWKEGADGKKYIEYPKGAELKVYLGFAMELPPLTEAITSPRGSSYKNYGTIQVNSSGVVDTNYSGDEDEWFLPLLSMKRGRICHNDRVGQFKITEVMKEYKFKKVKKLGNKGRGGHGSTGKQ